ncbi:flavoprotein oxygenase [Cladophialophora carrionii]|uniref:Flavoprotein oxygenase n=1 Tax=Cladophialophora carrionii TaxID=86049 RepID=A0A1C1CM40_9EURO|nr:flavoprotein oxygenase [Cladophialophora carrionii]
MASSPLQPVSPVQLDLEVEASAFRHSSPLSLRQEPHPSSSLYPPDDVLAHDYNFSGAIYEEGTSDTETEGLLEDRFRQEEDVLITNGRVFSGCSSISSFPASISQHLPLEDEQYDGPRTPSKRDSIAMSPSESAGDRNHPTTSPRAFREYPSPFRHPSSVRALQMKDEIMSETQSVLRHHRRTGSQMSSYSLRSSYSTHTSPTKRLSRSHRSSPSKGGSNLKKEFPLVLLHCTLLPPNIRVQPGSVEDSLILDSLPEDYKSRWVALRNKLADPEVSSRGVLIPHPREDLALLEERLLESLELEAPRIRHNHYFPSDGSVADSGFESASTEDETELDPSCEACPDCGRRLRPEEVHRKWEVKVFAANGLMRAGAWAAAWQEMEKVDVEIKVWLPDEIRQELEAKLVLLAAPQFETTELASQEAPAEPEINSLSEEDTKSQSRRSEAQGNARTAEEEPINRTEPLISSLSPVTNEQNVWTQLGSHARELTRDRRNVLVGVLSFLVLFFALARPEQPRQGSSSPTLVFETADTPKVLTTTITTTSVAVTTALVTVSDLNATPAAGSQPEPSETMELLSAEDLFEQPSETKIGTFPQPILEDSTSSTAP